MENEETVARPAKRVQNPNPSRTPFQWPGWIRKPHLLNLSKMCDGNACNDYRVHELKNKIESFMTDPSKQEITRRIREKIETQFNAPLTIKEAARAKNIAQETAANPPPKDNYPDITFRRLSLTLLGGAVGIEMNSDKLHDVMVDAAGKVYRKAKRLMIPPTKREAFIEILTALLNVSRSYKAADRAIKAEDFGAAILHTDKLLHELESIGRLLKILVLSGGLLSGIAPYVKKIWDGLKRMSVTESIAAAYVLPRENRVANAARMNRFNLGNAPPSRTIHNSLPELNKLMISILVLVAFMVGTSPRARTWVSGRFSMAKQYVSSMSSSMKRKFNGIRGVGVATPLKARKMIVKKQATNPRRRR